MRLFYYNIIEYLFYFYINKKIVKTSCLILIHKPCFIIKLKNESIFISYIAK